MAVAADELMLLERVFLRLGSAETDEQLENALGKFLSPVLLKLSSPHEQVRKKVMELLLHVNKRVKTRPLVQLPVEQLLNQYQDPSATSFTTNFTIIYLKLGFPRLPIETQVKLVPSVISSLKGKPQLHVDSLLLLVVPLLGKLEVPTVPEKIPGLFGLDEKPEVSKHLLGLLLDILLLPYGTLLLETENHSGNNEETPIPPSFSIISFKRIASSIKSRELEEIKLGIVKFLGHGIFKNDEVLTHLIVAAADTRFSVANLADTELKKVVGTIDWDSSSVCLPLYILFLGTQAKNVRPDMKKSPACTRIRLKVLTYLCRIRTNGFVFPMCIQIVFDALYGENTNSRLKTLAQNFTSNIIRDAHKEELEKVAGVLLSGLQKLMDGEEIHQGRAFVLIGQLAQRFPSVTYHNISLVEEFLTKLESASPDLKLQIREGILGLILAYKADIFPEEVDKGGRLSIFFGIFKHRLQSEESIIRFATVRALANVFPRDHIPSKVLLLQATGDIKDDVSSEAFKTLYGVPQKSDSELAKESIKVNLPRFEDIVRFLYNETETTSNETSEKKLSFPANIYNEVLVFLRLCLLRDLDVPLTRNVLPHPCDNTPVIREYLNSLYSNYKGEESSNPLIQYCVLIRRLLLSTTGIVPLSCMIELVGCVFKLKSILLDDVLWLRTQLVLTNEEVRTRVAFLYAILLSNLPVADFKAHIEFLLAQCQNKTLEAQHGAIFALGACFEYRITYSGLKESNEILVEVLKTLDQFLKHQNALLVGAACASIGSIARCTSLPIENGKPVKDGSPDAKRMADGKIYKTDVMYHLIDIMNNKKFHTKLREKAVQSLGYLCVGEQFPHAKEVMEALLDTAKETKDIEVHFTVGESMVMCCQSVWSPEARNKWQISTSDFAPVLQESLSDDNLESLLDELLKLTRLSHPNSRQASCIWLLAIVKQCSQRNPVKSRINVLQNTFMEMLCEKNDIIQDVASKGLCVVYDNYKSEELLAKLVKQLTSGATKSVKVESDTKIFEEDQLGKTPSGENLTTYKELCSLASDLNKPDLIYQFMQLANHNAIWNSKKGAAFGFSTIAARCGEELKKFLPQIVPKLYRYQYDPVPSIQNSMHNIWTSLVAEPQKTVEEFYDEILRDLLDNLNSNQYRTRQSCCLALQDILKGYGNKSIHDCLKVMDELWTKLFRVMDDHHEATRITATKTTRVCSKLCITACGEGRTKSGIEMVKAILPPLLKDGITNSVSDIRLISLETISELIRSSGKQVKQFLPQIIPALLQATGELESKNLSYLSTRLGGQTQAQELVDSARASFAKSHFTTETVTKSLQYADQSILEELIPKIIDLMKSSVGLGSKVACCHCITLLVTQMGQDLQPYTGKILGVLVNGLMDRNAAVRKHYAQTIGHVVSTAKETSLEKLFQKLHHWYFEREDESVRLAIAYAIQSTGNHNQDILKTHSELILPLVFFAMHTEETEESKSTIAVWKEIWSDQSPGTEAGIRQNIENICDNIKSALESASWTMKAQGASSVVTVANTLGSSLEEKHLTQLISILLNGLSGRTWTGKEKLLKALASICSNCQDSIKQISTVDSKNIVDIVLKECRKQEIKYKIHSLTYSCEIVSSLEIDVFDEIYAIIEGVLTDDDEVKEDENSTAEMADSREDRLKLKAVAYETLGKAWPAKSAQTQEKYRELFVEHCAERLPLITRSIQISVLEAMYNFVEKLTLLNECPTEDKDVKSLGIIVGSIVTSLRYTLGITKYTKLRKESLNIVMSLGKKLKTIDRTVEFNDLRKMVLEHLPQLQTDTNPEIRSRIKDVNNLFNGV